VIKTDEFFAKTELKQAGHFEMTIGASEKLA